MNESDIERFLEMEAKPGILLRRVWPVLNVAPQNSWVGGLPRLPEGLVWPENTKTGLALHHLAQIDLAEMPQVKTDAALPSKGMLWFFADIDSELCWDQGPEMGQARVVFHPKTTADKAFCEPPDNLPEVDHEGDTMAKHPIGMGPARFRTYPRWPVTGHALTTWPLDDVPDGVEWGGPYRDRRQDTFKAQIAEVLGPPPDRVEPVSAGQNAPGHVFPYNIGLALEIVRELHFKVESALQGAEGTIVSADWSLKHARSGVGSEEKRKIYEEAALERIRVATEAAPKCRQAMEQMAAFLSNLDAAELAVRLSEVEQTTFDQVLADYDRDPLVPHYEANDAVGRGRERLPQMAFDQPELMASLPEHYRQGLRNIHSPWRQGEHHFLLGAKAFASNATLGYGVRLAQFCSDYAMDFMFCDCGIIDFWIDADDLANNRWDRAWASTAGG
jgi:hypothetical protein